MITPDFVTDTKLVGVTADNDSGVPIQILLPMLKPNDPLIFIREYNNRYDPNAIKVFGKSGQHIGYLKKELTAELSPFLDQHSEIELEGTVNEITGGNGKNYGCNIRIWLRSYNSPDYDEFEFFTEQYKNPYGTQNVNPPAQQDIYHQTKNIILIGVIILMVIFALAKCDDVLTSLFDDDSSTDAKNARSTIPADETIDDDLITLNEYNKLRIGMSRSEVYDIIGSFGEKVSESSTDGYHLVMYSYEGYGSAGANAQLMFENSNLTSMAQYGLEYYWGDDSSDRSNTTDSMMSEIVEPPVKVGDIPFDLKVLPPNSIDTIWLETTFVNNSDKPITYLSVKILLKDTNKTTYLSCTDTVMPGETSPIFKTFGPESQNKNDIEFLTCTIKTHDDNGEEIYVEYDYKLKKYRTF